MPTSPTAAYSFSAKVRLRNVPGVLGALCTAIGKAGGNIAALEGFEAKTATITRDMAVNARDEDHADRLIEAMRAVDGVELVDHYDRTFRMHEGGKIEVLPLCPVGDRDDLSMAYTPGVARVCMAIHDNPALAHKYTIKKNTVAIVSDGTAVLGLGDIGPEAAMPVMEGKALLFKAFAGVDAFPVCINAKDPAEIIETVERLGFVESVAQVLRQVNRFGSVGPSGIDHPGGFVQPPRQRLQAEMATYHAKRTNWIGNEIGQLDLQHAAIRIGLQPFLNIID